jgi:hypothetical protein
MLEWTIQVPDELAADLEESLARGPIVDERGRRLLEEEQFGKIGGLKVEVFSKEHPPPHFRVSYQGQTNNYTIADCTPMNGNALSKYFRNITRWHEAHKQDLIAFWNFKRPADCPVGEYREQ